MPVREVTARELLGGKSVIASASTFPGLSKAHSKTSAKLS
jgi:hypothetical protein